MCVHSTLMVWNLAVSASILLEMVDYSSKRFCVDHHFD